MRYLLLAVAITLAGCGNEKGVTGDPITPPRVEQTNPENTCPLSFASEGLCAKITWLTGPSTETDSKFEITFWKKDTTAPFVEPKGQVGSFLRMTCCGSVFPLKAVKAADGKYTAEATLAPGSWELFVQLKQGDQVDKQFIPLTLE